MKHGLSKIWLTDQFLNNDSGVARDPSTFLNWQFLRGSNQASCQIAT